MKRIFSIAIFTVGLAMALVFASMRDEVPAMGQVQFAGPTETAVFAGGCFWGLQAAFDKLPGVVKTRVGYTGGTTSNPTYEQVVAGKTGHAEAVEVVFDPSRISFEGLARHFFKHHRPTSDEPESTYRTRAYRSTIFASDEVQRAVARRLVAAFAERNTSDKRIGTLIEDATTFWEAEAYHQKYLAQCAH
jgi:methionine-S-sulfoxide reductase